MNRYTDRRNQEIEYVYLNEFNESRKCGMVIPLCEEEANLALRKYIVQEECLQIALKNMQRNPDRNKLWEIKYVRNH